MAILGPILHALGVIWAWTWRTVAMIALPILIPIKLIKKL